MERRNIIFPLAQIALSASAQQGRHCKAGFAVCVASLSCSHLRMLCFGWQHQHQWQSRSDSASAMPGLSCQSQSPGATPKCQVTEIRVTKLPFLPQQKSRTLLLQNTERKTGGLKHWLRGNPSYTKQHGITIRNFKELKSQKTEEGQRKEDGNWSVH